METTYVMPDPPSSNEITDSHHVTIIDVRKAPTSGEHDLDREVVTGHESLLSHEANCNNTGIAHCRPSQPPHYLTLAILVTVFVNLPFGAHAILFSLLSRQSYAKNHFESAKTRGNISKWLSIIGFALSIVVIAIVILYYAYIKEHIVDTFQELQNA